MPRPGFTYIFASKKNGTLYVGVTSTLAGRVRQHKEGQVEGFTKRYDVARLEYFERHNDIRAAIRREKQIKNWNRAWKIRLIEESNPMWNDLFDDLANT